ncbi:hypothetical protein ONZ45_g19429 [Pleurotus djamor]|nr:hypothetical protein ONZ45_g19429 [Pleurotus djamor]
MPPEPPGRHKSRSKNATMPYPDSHPIRKGPKAESSEHSRNATSGHSLGPTHAPIPPLTSQRQPRRSYVDVDGTSTRPPSFQHWREKNVGSDSSAASQTGTMDLDESSVHEAGGINHFVEEVSHTSDHAAGWNGISDDDNGQDIPDDQRELDMVVGSNEGGGSSATKSVYAHGADGGGNNLVGRLPYPLNAAVLPSAVMPSGKPFIMTTDSLVSTSSIDPPPAFPSSMIPSSHPERAVTSHTVGSPADEGWNGESDDGTEPGMDVTDEETDVDVSHDPPYRGGAWFGGSNDESDDDRDESPALAASAVVSHSEEPVPIIAPPLVHSAITRSPGVSLPPGNSLPGSVKQEWNGDSGEEQADDEDMQDASNGGWIGRSDNESDNDRDESSPLDGPAVIPHSGQPIPIIAPRVTGLSARPSQVVSAQQRASIKEEWNGDSGEEQADDEDMQDASNGGWIGRSDNESDNDHDESSPLDGSAVISHSGQPGPIIASPLFTGAITRSPGVSLPPGNSLPGSVKQEWNGDSGEEQADDEDMQDASNGGWIGESDNESDNDRDESSPLDGPAVISHSGQPVPIPSPLVTGAITRSPGVSLPPGNSLPGSVKQEWNGDSGEEQADDEDMQDASNGGWIGESDNESDNDHDESSPLDGPAVIPHSGQPIPIIAPRVTGLSARPSQVVSAQQRASIKEEWNGDSGEEQADDEDMQDASNGGWIGRSDNESDNDHDESSPLDGSAVISHSEQPGPIIASPLFTGAITRSPGVSLPPGNSLPGSVKQEWNGDSGEEQADDEDMQDASNGGWIGESDNESDNDRDESSPLDGPAVISHSGQPVPIPSPLVTGAITRSPGMEWR